MLIYVIQFPSIPLHCLAKSILSVYMNFNKSSNASAFVSVILTSSGGKSFCRIADAPLPYTFAICLSLASFACRILDLNHCDL